MNPRWFDTERFIALILRCINDLTDFVGTEFFTKERTLLAFPWDANGSVKVLRGDTWIFFSFTGRVSREIAFEMKFSLEFFFLILSREILLREGFMNQTDQIIRKTQRVSKACIRGIVYNI